jgi:hypothetical protein
MSCKIARLFLRSGRFCMSAGLVSLIAFCSMNCDSKNPVAAVPAPSNLAYSRATAWLFTGNAVAIAPPTSSGGTVASYSVSPALPAGLTLNATTGAITGTPAQEAAMATYTVTASNSGGSTTFHLGISITNTALVLASPAGGENFSFTDSIPVKWIGNVDSLGLQELRSYAMQFSLDSGRSWIEMSHPLESEIADSNVYRIAWKGLDTAQVDPLTYQSLTKADFLNKGILAHIVSYPPKKITRASGFFFFHE